MDKVIEIVVWFVVAIALPACVPYLVLSGLWGVNRGNTDPAVRFSLLPVQGYKDGQLLWVALTTCFIAIYEVSLALMKAPSGWSVVTLVFLIVLLVCNALLIGNTAGRSVPLAEDKQDRDLVIMSWSIWLMAITASGALAAHARLMLTMMEVGVTT
jgi:hypothetical protein